MPTNDVFIIERRLMLGNLANFYASWLVELEFEGLT